MIILFNKSKVHNSCRFYQVFAVQLVFRKILNLNRINLTIIIKKIFKGSYSCSCKPGYDGDATEECNDIDECAEGLIYFDIFVKYCSMRITQINLDSWPLFNVIWQEKSLFKVFVK